LFVFLTYYISKIVPNIFPVDHTTHKTLTAYSMETERSLITDPYNNPFESMVDSSIFAPIQAVEPWSFAARGKLFLIVGSAGAGKTTIINRVKKIVGEDSQYAFPKRVIVKSKTEEDEEDFDDVTKMMFTSMEKNGEFAVWWTSHQGVDYGIRAKDIDDALNDQKNVVIQVSRSAIADIRKRYGETNRITAIELTADPSVLNSRLSQFKKMSDTEIKEKLKRTETLKTTIQQIPNIVTVENNESINEGVNKVLRALNYTNIPAEVVAAPPLEVEKETAIVVNESIPTIEQVTVNENVVMEEPRVVDTDNVLNEVSKEFFDNGAIRNLIHQKAEVSDAEHKQNERREQETALRRKTPTPTKTTVTTTTTVTPKLKGSPGESKIIVQKEKSSFFSKAIKWVGIVGAVSAIGWIVAKRFKLFGK
jgi:phosphonate metabolism protein PhnN/1,5-bisphosphokinase (PRPP-forming)